MINDPYHTARDLGRLIALAEETLQPKPPKGFAAECIAQPRKKFTRALIKLFRINAPKAAEIADKVGQLPETLDESETAAAWIGYHTHHAWTSWPLRDRIKYVMELHGITQRELATKLGVTHNAVNYAISNPNVQLLTLARYAEAIGCTVNDFF